MKKGLLLIYGDGLPGAGVIFLAPINKRDMLTKVHEAMRVCHKKYPRPGRTSMFKDRYADGSLSKDEQYDKEWFMTSKAWKGDKFEWNETTNKFEEKYES